MQRGTMDTVQHNRIADFIWGITDYLLRDTYIRSKYRDVNRRTSAGARLAKRHAFRSP
jgi:hypothetical protein